MLSTLCSTIWIAQEWRQGPSPEFSDPLNKIPAEVRMPAVLCAFLKL